MTIPSPTTSETVVTTPLIPGLELHMSAGTVIHDHRDGSYARTISITPIPVDRPPFPMPVDAEFPVFFTIQPGGTYIHSYGASTRGTWLVYPNARGAREGKRVQFFNYDPKGPGWYVYGMGTVKGNQVVPDARTRLYRFTGASFNDGQTPPPAGPTPGDDCGKCADPVSLATGIFTFDTTDLYIPDVLPIAVTRSYNSRDPEVRPFGRGMTHAYAIFQHSESNFNEADLYLPDGGKIHYARISPPEVPWYAAEFEHTATPTAFYKSNLKMVGNRFHITLKDGTVYIFGHGAPLQAIRDRYGNEITISWSLVNAFEAGTGNITRLTSPNGRWIEFTYYAGTSRVYQAKDNIGRTVTYAYDANGNLTSVTDPMNYVTTYTYDASNRMTGIKPPNLQGTPLNLVTNEYTTAADAPTPVGWVKKQTHADGGIFRFAYTAVNGKSTQTDVTDPRGYVRRVTFSPSGYTLQDTRAFGEANQQVTAWERQAIGNFVVATTDSLNRQRTHTYDDNGNVISVTRLAGTQDAITTTYTYEPLFQQLATIKDPLLHTWTLAYDDQGKLTSITDPLSHVTTIAINGSGQITSFIDPLSHLWQIGYTGGDRTSGTNPLGATWKHFFDSGGRLRSSTDALGRTTRREVDALNRPTRITDALGGQTSFDYDANSNLLLVADGLTHATVYTYDASDRIATRMDPLEKQAAYEYDANHNLTSHVDRKGQISRYEYDQHSRLTLVTFQDGSTIQYTYDVGNRLIEIADSMNGTISRTYDDLDRLISEGAPHGTISYTYSKDGHRASMTVSGQETISYAYDDGHRLTSITQGSSVVTIAYDDADRRSTVSYPNGVLATYGYDSANQLTSLAYTLSGSPVGDLTYTYDLTGNRIVTGGAWARTSLPRALTAANYDAANRLSDWSSQKFSYDANGNMASDGSTTYVWDTRNQLTGLSGRANANFEYDANGRRRTATIGGASTSFLYDGENVVQELSGPIIVDFLNGLGLDEVFARVESVGMFFPAKDALGSTVALIAENMNAKSEYTYEPFGTTIGTGSPTSNPSQFAGRENDGTGVYYFRARYYSPESGRFISEDPLEFRDGPNLYLYAHNNPVLLNDPLGLEAPDWREIVGTVRNVGPVDAWTGYRASQQASADARNSGLPGPLNGPADAFRHCLWSCRLTETLGFNQAKAIADEHENAGDRNSQTNDRAMDEANNAAGRACAAETDPVKKRNCYDKCMDLLFKGGLYGPGGRPMTYSGPRPR